MKRAIRVTLVAALLYAGAAQADTLCTNDLEDIAAFLPLNDAGADAALRHHATAIEDALSAARKAAAAATDEQSCVPALRTYLQAWRKGHLSLAPWPWSTASELATQGHGRADAFHSTLKVLSQRTVLLTFPTFYDGYQRDIAQLLEKNRKTLENHPDWIIDVRRNNGGSDDSFAPLMPWLMSGAYVLHNVSWLATPANIQAQQDVCGLVGDRAACEKMMEPITSGMRAVPQGQYAIAKGGRAITYGMEANVEKHAPQHVAIMIDRDCGSSCEQFLLQVRQSQRVKLLGRPTSGQLDVSNLRPHVLPSGVRAVFYATSRSGRLPAMPIDDIGVQPDILLPASAPEDEVLRVQRWLEGGSLE